MEDTAKECLGTVDVAALLGISPRTLEAWRLRKVGPKYSRLGPRLVRYRRSDLDAWVAENSQRESISSGGVTPAVERNEHGNKPR